MAEHSCCMFFLQRRLFRLSLKYLLGGRGSLEGMQQPGRMRRRAAASIMHRQAEMYLLLQNSSFCRPQTHCAHTCPASAYAPTP